jgi:flagellum-specific peptidoglycan hydrolase FlgJ
MKMTLETFVKQYGDVCRKALVRLAKVWRIILAQTAHESGNGNHAPGFNFFGIKAGKSWIASGGLVQNLMTTEVYDGVSRRVIQPFRKYASPADSFKDYERFIMVNQRYKAALDMADTGQEQDYLHEVARAGYATDPNYEALVRDKYFKVLTVLASMKVVDETKELAATIAGGGR